MKALGMARTAEVKRDARIGEADAKRDAQIKEAIAEEERMAARLLNDAEIAKSKRDFELKKAAYDVEVHTKVSYSPLHTLLFKFQNLRKSMFSSHIHLFRTSMANESVLSKFCLIVVVCG